MTPSEGIGINCNTEPPANGGYALILGWLESPSLILGQLVYVPQIFLGDLSCLTGRGLEHGFLKGYLVECGHVILKFRPA